MRQAMTQCVNNTNAYTLMGSLSLLQARISPRTELIASESAAGVMAGHTWSSYEARSDFDEENHLYVQIMGSLSQKATEIN